MDLRIKLETGLREANAAIPLRLKYTNIADVIRSGR